MANQTSNPASAALGLGAGQGSGGGVPVVPQALAEKPKRQGGGGRGGNTKGPVDADPGQSTVNLYWLTKGEMWALGGAGFIWSLFYSIGSFLIGFSIDAKMNVELAPGSAPEVVAKWTAYSNSAYYGGLACLIVATIAIVGTGFGVFGVLKRTTHRNKGTGMSQGKHLSLEEARKLKKLDRFAKEHQSEGDADAFEALLEAMAEGRKKPSSNQE